MVAVEPMSRTSDRADVIARFNNLYLGDSLLQLLLVETGDARVVLTFNGARVLKGDGASIFDPLAKFEPAQLRLHRVKAIELEGGTYRLNSTVVDFGARPGADELVEFYFDLTGGTDLFGAKLKVLAADFDLGPVDARRP